MSQTFKFAKGDLARDEQGRLEMVSGIDKFAQDLAFHLMTEFDPITDSGCELVTMDIPALTGKDSAEGVIAAMVRRAVARLDRHQQLIEDEIGADERFNRIRRLAVKKMRDLSNSYVYLLEVEVVSTDTKLVAMQVDLSHQDIGDSRLIR